MAACCRVLCLGTIAELMSGQLVALVAAAEAETTRRALDREGLLNTALRAHRTSEGYIALPLAACAEPHPTAGSEETLVLDWSGGQLLVQQSSGPARQRERGPTALLHSACERALTEAQAREEDAKGVLQNLPKRWEKLGDIVLLATTAPFDECVGALTSVQQQSLWKALAGAIGANRLGVQGRIETSLHRKSTAQLLWPPSPLGGAWTEHRCNGITYGFDVTRNMFSSGNGTEKARVGRFACAGEVVVDLYAGIGYFTLAYLVHAHAAHVHACEWDADALHALRHNLDVNHVAGRCTVHPGDNAASVPAFQGCAHRVNLGLIPSSEAGWPLAIAALREEGGILHVHANVSSDEGEEARWIDGLLASLRSLSAAEGREWKVSLEHLERVKWYAPRIRHVVADVRCERIAPSGAPSCPPSPPAPLEPRCLLPVPHQSALVLMLVGAFFFASANVLAKSIYWRGMSQVALFLVRGVVVFGMNGALEAVRSGSAAARRVLTLRIGTRQLMQRTLMRSAAGFLGISLLNISFQLISLADAFALFLSSLTLVTALLARVCLDAGSERLTPQALGGGVLTLIGIMCITQPTFLFGGRPPSGVGVALAIGGGIALSVFNVLSRMLGRANVSASMLVSYYMVVIGAGTALIAAVAQAVGPSAPFWATLVLSDDPAVWLYVLLYCGCILVGQLFLAFGYARLPAWKAAILTLTELGFSWTLDVFVLREPTNTLASTGTLVIFAGCVLAASGSDESRAKPLAADDSAAVEVASSPVSDEQGVSCRSP